MNNALPNLTALKLVNNFTSIFFQDTYCPLKIHAKLTNNILLIEITRTKRVTDNINILLLLRAI